MGIMAMSTSVLGKGSIQWAKRCSIELLLSLGMGWDLFLAVWSSGFLIFSLITKLPLERRKRI